MDRIARFVRQFLGSFMAVRFAASLLAALAVVVHAVLFMVSAVPHYAELALRLRLTPAGLLIIAYVSIALLVSLLWWLLAGREGVPFTRYQRLRPLYRTTDRSGLGLYDALMCVVVLLGVWAVTNYFPYIYSLPVQFLAFLVLFPMLLGWLPTRPRRYWTPVHGETMLDLARFILHAPAPSANADQGNQMPQENPELTTLVERAAWELHYYNEFDVRRDRQGNVAGDPLREPLPEGVVIENPPQL